MTRRNSKKSSQHHRMTLEVVVETGLAEEASLDPDKNSNVEEIPSSDSSQSSERVSRTTWASRPHSKLTNYTAQRPRSSLSAVKAPSITRRNLNHLDATQMPGDTFYVPEGKLFLLKAALSPMGPQMLIDNVRRNPRFTRSALGQREHKHERFPTQGPHSASVNHLSGSKEEGGARCVEDVFDWQLPLKDLVKVVAAVQEENRQSVRQSQRTKKTDIESS